MKVIAALNGSITSEAAAIYAIRYCQLFKYELVLLHIRNGEDDIGDVENSMDNIETLADAAEIDCERLLIHGKGVTPLVAYANQNNIDTIFCTARTKRGFFSTSFSDYLTRATLACNVAVVRVANLMAINQVNKIGLSISDAKLSVEKFAFFSSMVHAYDAYSELYSVIVHSIYKRESMEFEEKKELFENINDRLVHYRHLAQLQGMNLHIKHAIAESEIDQILHHAAHAEYDLLIVGGKRLSYSNFFTSVTPLEKLMRNTSVNVIAFYPRTTTNV